LETPEFSHTVYGSVNERGDSYRRLRLDPLGLTPILAQLSSPRLAQEIHVLEVCPATNLEGRHVVDMLRDELRSREWPA